MEFAVVADMEVRGAVRAGRSKGEDGAAAYEFKGGGLFTMFAADVHR